MQRQDEHDVGTGSGRRPPVSLNIKSLIQNILPETARNKSLADIFKVYRVILYCGHGTVWPTTFRG